MTRPVASLWNQSTFSTTGPTAGFVVSMGIATVFPAVHTPYKHYQVLSFT